MAMSLKKIGAIAIGGAMVATSLASGAMAATTSGDVSGFMKDVVKDGEPNVEIVVGSNAAAMDVVSAADIAAKIGSMCYKEAAVEDGSVDLEVTASTDSELSQNLNREYGVGDTFLVFTTPKRDYTNELGRATVLEGLVKSNAEIRGGKYISKYFKNAYLRGVSMNIRRGRIENGVFNGIVKNGEFDGIVKNGEFDGVIYESAINKNIDRNINGNFDDAYIDGFVNGSIDGILSANMSGTLINGTIGKGGNETRYEYLKIQQVFNNEKITGTFIGTILGKYKGEINGYANITVNGTFIDGIIDGTIYGNISNGSISNGYIRNGSISNGYIRNMNLSSTYANFNGNIRYIDKDIKKVQKLSRLSTLIRDTDADPNDVTENPKADAIEFLLAAVEKVYNDDIYYEIGKKDLVYGTLMFKNKGKNVNDSISLETGMELPLLGKTYRIAKIDKDNDKIYLGKEAFSKILLEGTVHDIGNGYQVKVAKVLVHIDDGDPTVYVEILKDGKVVARKNAHASFTFLHKDVGVYVHSAYRDVPSNNGYASIIATKDVKGYELGETFEGDWKIYGIIAKDNDNNGIKDSLEITDDIDGICGLALRYEGDKFDELGGGSTVDFINDYAALEFTDDDEEDALFARYKMKVSKDLTLEKDSHVHVLNTCLEVNDIDAVAQQVVPVKAPIAKLDSETSLDSNKNMILVGGPVANKLTKELQEAGKVNIDNDSPATIQVVDGNILVVAGGDRNKTREAALYLIENY